MEFQAFHRDVYLNSALRHRTTGILRPVESDLKSPRWSRHQSTTPSFRLASAQAEVHENRHLQINAPPMSYLCQLLTMNGFSTVKARCINLLRLPLS